MHETWVYIHRFRQILLLTACFCQILISPTMAFSGEECLIICNRGSVQEIEQMLTAHSVEELYRVRDDSGRGLLHLAVARSPEHVRLLLNAGWPVSREKGWTPQHEASLLGKLPNLQALVKKGGPLTVQEPLNGGTPLHVAAFNGHLPVVQYLVQAGASVNARDREGWTALSQARDQGFPNIVEWLKKNGATR